MRFLLAEGRAALENRDEEGATGRMTTAACGNEKMVPYLLLEAKACLETQDQRGRQAWLIAAVNGHQRVTHYLCDIAIKREDNLTMLPVKQAEEASADRTEAKRIDMHAGNYSIDASPAKKPRTGAAEKSHKAWSNDSTSFIDEHGRLPSKNSKKTKRTASWPMAQ